MDQILTIRLYAAGIGIVVGEFLGSFDDLLYALVAFVATTMLLVFSVRLWRRNCRAPSASRESARKSASSPLSAWRMC